MKKISEKTWSELTSLEKSEYCFKIAETYPEGREKDKVLDQARRLKLLHEKGKAK